MGNNPNGLKSPRLVQRCIFHNGGLAYENMYSAEYSCSGEQARSLMRIFNKGIDHYATSVKVGGKETPVWMSAVKGFPFLEYQRYLQDLAEGKRQLHEPAYFNVEVEVRLGINARPVYRDQETKVWFDFQNDVLWTLGEKNHSYLLKTLDTVLSKWTQP